MVYLNGSPHERIVAANAAHAVNDEPIIVLPEPTLAPVVEEPVYNWTWPVDPDSLRAMSTLIRMLEYKRPHQSKSEIKFIKRFILPLGVRKDAFGNYWKLVMPKKGDIHILWSAHTDTVHRLPGTQRVVITKGKYAKLAHGETSNCLGADDAAGCWLLREMILKRIPGLYVFHRLEEHGGRGAEHFVRHNKVLLEGIEGAIAFDRRGYSSIITHQRNRRTASDEFARSLAAALDMDHVPDNTGTYTDTCEYERHVPECSNVSVGYFEAHSSGELLDLLYLANLRIAVLKADFSRLVFVRDPSVREWSYSNNNSWQKTAHPHSSVEDYYGTNLAKEFYQASGRSPPQTFHGHRENCICNACVASWRESIKAKPSTITKLNANGHSLDCPCGLCRAKPNDHAKNCICVTCHRWRNGLTQPAYERYESTANAGRILPVTKGETWEPTSTQASAPSSTSTASKSTGWVRGFKSEDEEQPPHPLSTAYDRSMHDLWGDPNEEIANEADKLDGIKDDDAEDNPTRHLDAEGQVWLREALEKYPTILDVVKHYPDEVADYMEGEGADVTEILVYIKNAYNL